MMDKRQRLDYDHYTSKPDQHIPDPYELNAAFDAYNQRILGIASDLDMVSADFSMSGDLGHAAEIDGMADRVRDLLQPYPEPPLSILDDLIAGL